MLLDSIRFLLLSYEKVKNRNNNLDKSKAEIKSA